MRVSVTSRQLCRARAVKISREVIRIDNLSLDERAADDSLFQRLHIEIKSPWWWYDWRSKVMIWESNPETSEQTQPADERANEEPVW